MWWHSDAEVLHLPMVNILGGWARKNKICRLCTQTTPLAGAVRSRTEKPKHIPRNEEENGLDIMI